MDVTGGCRLRVCERLILASAPCCGSSDYYYFGYMSREATQLALKASFSPLDLMTPYCLQLANVSRYNILDKQLKETPQAHSSVSRFSCVLGALSLFYMGCSINT